MNIILLSGGSGKRLWPLSNDVRSKQFIKIFVDKSGGKESMIQRMYSQIKKIDPTAKITIATSKSQVSELKNQLGDNITISLEPCRKDTFPAIALATLYLTNVENVSENDSVVVCPVDSYADDDYFETLEKLSNLAKEGISNLVLLGIKPTYPSEKYGYIIPKTTNKTSSVLSFKEKPTKEEAKKYIKEGALWNAGIFAFKIKYLIKKIHELVNFKDYQDFLSIYSTLDKISFDYAVVEHELSIEVMKFSGRWEDLGTWNTLADSMHEKSVGNVIDGGRTEGTHIINDLNIPILCLGAKNLIVAASAEGILVADKKGSTQIKPYIDKLASPIMFAEKSWGQYRVLDTCNNSMIIKATLKKGCSMSYHSHQYRNEVWIIISGEGITVTDGLIQHVHTGDIVSIKAGIKHTICAHTSLELIEIQFGQIIDVRDKKKYKLDLVSLK